MTKTNANLLGLSLILAISGFAPAAQAADPSEQLKKADLILQEGNPKASVEILREVIRTNPDSAQAHMQLGMALAALDSQAEKADYETAILEEKQALKLDPKSFGARIMLGHIYANLNKGPEAIAIIKEAIEIKPTSYGAHRDLGIAYLVAEKPEEAQAEFKKAIEINPKKYDAHMKLALVHSSNANFRDALNEAMEAVNLAGKASEAVESQLVFGTILIDSRNESEAIRPFKAVLAKEKNNPIALSGLGWALAQTDGKIEDGIRYQRSAIKVYPYMPAYVRLAELLLKQNKPAEAEDEYKNALKINPDDPRVRTAYAKFLDGNGRKDDARGELKKVLDKKPNFKPASDALAGLDKKSSTK